ncbi:hypothetical protein PV327_001954 [Microctonus hyperodae]|uniref:SET and MYND domain-containing protein 4 n=1 Tax=Microctonus hyperodae TaxID=165561 RepID=A0AA39FEL8_MICHY|nr:hypothetical protein PV327_001954 [Microctonus hyperodae]
MSILRRVFSEYDNWKGDFLYYITQFMPHGRTDEDKIKVLFGYLMSTHRKWNIQSQSKSTTKARVCIEEGEKKLQVQLWPDAVEIFTKAIMHAEIDSYELVLGYTKRCVALCNSGMYINALPDIERALIINCSNNELDSLTTTQLECLDIIEYVICHGNVEALDHAHKCEIDDISKKSPSKPPQINSPKIQKSDTILFKYDKKFGRYAVAERNILAGEVLVTYRIYATVISSYFRHRYCWNCYKKTWAGIACLQCVNVIYCDETCRDTAWREYHEIECSVICAVSCRELFSLDLIALRLTMKAYKEAGTLENLQRKIHEIDQKRDPITKCLTSDILESTNYASVYSLSRNARFNAMSAVRAVAILCSLAATTNIFGEKINDLETLSKNKYATFIGGLIKRNLGICMVNSTKLTMDRSIGINLDPHQNMFVHSENPNAVMTTSSGGTLTLTAIQNIQKGEKIFLRCDPEFSYNRYGKRII